MTGAERLRPVPDDDIEAEIDRALALLGPVADQPASRAPVAQYEADIGNPAATRKGTSIADTTGPLPRFLPVRDILRIAFNIESLVPAVAIPRRQARSPRTPTDDNLALAIPYAPNLLDALVLVARYGDATVPWYRRSITPVGDTLRIAYWPLVPLGRIEALATEVAFGTIYRIVETFVGDRVADARLTFALQPVSSPAAIAERFSCAVSIGGSCSYIDIPAGWGALPSPYHDPNLWLEGVARCEADMAALRDLPMVSRVRGHVLAVLDQSRAPALSDTARALGLSGRSLVRMLAAAGQTHHAIVDSERRARASLLLARSGLPIGLVADQLGFSDQSSFGRKCRAWFGESPSAVRRRLQGAGPA